MSWEEFKNNQTQGQECPSQIHREAEYYYSTGTARPPRKRTGLFVLMTLLLILLSVVVSLLMSLRIQIAKSADGKIALYVTDGNSAEKSEETPATQTPSTAEQAPESMAIPAPEVAVGSSASLQISEPAEEGTETLSLQQIYQKVIPSVVSIINQTATGEITGTGIIMTTDGYIITNYHVIQNTAALQVSLQDNSVYYAALVGSDETSDLAVLKIDTTGLTAAEFGSSEALQVGDSVVTIGDPLGTQLRGTMTDGIISGINRDLVIDGRTMTLIQTNAALNSGNSGGPLINMKGQVIGINTMKMSASFTNASVEGLGFAIPISVAKEIIDELLTNGYVAGRPAIGISGEAVPVTAQAYYRLPAGVYVRSVEETSDAYAKGIRAGDIITAINDTEVTSVEDLNTVKNMFQAGETVTLTVYHSGTIYQAEVTLMDASGITQ